MNDVILDFRQVEVGLLWGWWEAGEQELQGLSNADADEELQSYLIHDRRVLLPQRRRPRAPVDTGMDVIRAARRTS